jgi:hypothetical protein
MIDTVIERLQEIADMLEDGEDALYEVRLLIESLHKERELGRHG